MFKTLLARARQGYRTAPYPVPDPGLPALFRGRPVLDPDDEDHGVIIVDSIDDAVRATPCGVVAG